MKTTVNRQSTGILKTKLPAKNLANQKTKVVNSQKGKGFSFLGEKVEKWPSTASRSGTGGGW